MKFMYVPSHVSIEGNEEVNKSTKSAEIPITLYYPNPNDINQTNSANKLAKFKEL